MTMSVDIHDLPNRLSEALAFVSSGNEVILTNGQSPCARLVALGEAPARVAGLHAGAMQPAPGFDAALPDEFWNGQP